MVEDSRKLLRKTPRRYRKHEAERLEPFNLFRVLIGIARECVILLPDVHRPAREKSFDGISILPGECADLWGFEAGSSPFSGNAADRRQALPERSSAGQRPGSRATFGQVRRLSSPKSVSSKTKVSCEGEGTADPTTRTCSRSRGPVARVFSTRGTTISSRTSDTKRFIDRPRGKVYSGADNANLLTRSACEPGRMRSAGEG